MKIVFLAGPYRSGDGDIRGVVENIRMAESIAIKLWKMGAAVICPHLNSALLNGICEEARFLEGYLSIVQRCDSLVVWGNWEKSEGTFAEIEKAKLSFIPCFDWTWEERFIGNFIRGDLEPSALDVLLRHHRADPSRTTFGSARLELLNPYAVTD